MSNVAQRVFVLGGNTTYMTLANEEFVRPLSISNNWTKLRLGIMCAVTPDGTNNFLTTTFALGICSGQANPFGSNNTTNWTGVEIFPASTVNYTANSGNPYYAGASLAAMGKRVGNTNTTSQPGGVFQVGTNTGSVQRRSVLYIDITKGSPNYTIAAFTQGTSNMAVDYTFANFLDGMEQTSTPSLNGVAWTALNSATFANSEVAGIYDTFDLFWSKSQFPMEIYAMAVYRQQ